MLLGLVGRHSCWRKQSWVGGGGGGSPVSGLGVCSGGGWWEREKQRERQEESWAEVFGFGASRARALACCIPGDQHHGVSFHLPPAPSPSHPPQPLPSFLNLNRKKMTAKDLYFVNVSTWCMACVSWGVAQNLWYSGRIISRPFS